MFQALWLGLDELTRAGTALRCSGCPGKVPQTGWFEQVHFLRVLEAGYGVGFILKPFSSACRWPCSPCVLTWSSVGVCVLIFPSYKDTGQIAGGGRPTPIT